MIKKIGSYTFAFENGPKIIGYGSVVGKKEAEGPLKDLFDKIVYDSHGGTDSWEKAESMLQQEALSIALNKAGCNADDVQMIFAGDLLNQCISSTYGLRDFNIPYLGQYAACSTMAQSLIMSAIMVESGVASTTACITSSHFCSAERQYRFPLEYGGQRTPTAQWTVTGSGGCIVGGSHKKQPAIKTATVGRILDLGITDANNMGAAMAPAAAQTLKDFFTDTKTQPSDYDRIYTGDLGQVGSELLYQLLEKDNIHIKNNHSDCGLLIFDSESQDVHAGGSGCGCSASVLCSYIMNKLEQEQQKNILFMATGALMSPTSVQQGESIPSIAHLVNIAI